MSTAAKAPEPTMEEILASIRRIISDDEPAAAAKPAAKAAEPAPANGQDALGQDDIDAMFASFDAPQVEAPKKVEPVRSEPVKAEAPKPVQSVESADDLDVLELTDEMADEPEWPEPEPAPVRQAKREEPVRPLVPAPEPAPAAYDRLLSSGADDAVTSAFGSLANTILTSNARTLDDIVKEMLRPMLRAWLDDNLPPLVERLVRQEIERVARGGR